MYRACEYKDQMLKKIRTWVNDILLSRPPPCDYAGVSPENSCGTSFAITPRKYPPGTKPIHAGKYSWGTNFKFAPIHAGPVLALAQIQENILEEQFSSYFPYLGGEFMSVQMHAAPVFAPAQIQGDTPGELFMYWFRSRGYYFLIRSRCGCGIGLAVSYLDGPTITSQDCTRAGPQNQRETSQQSKNALTPPPKTHLLTKIRGFAKGWFPKGGFGGCSPVPKTGTRVHSDVPPVPKTGTRVHSNVPRYQNRTEGTFAKTTLLRNRLFVSSRKMKV